MSQDEKRDLYAVLGVALVQPNHFRSVLIQNWHSVSSLILAGAVIVTVGLIDDRIGLRGWHKLCGQLLAASILVYDGLIIQGIGLFGLEIQLGWLAVPITLFWLLGAVNALNLLDGIDGLATMVGIILVSTIAAMAMMMIPAHLDVVIIGVVFAGALVGFMRFNFPPASIFLGDTGSMLIGLMVGALAIMGSLKTAGTVLLAAPLAVWAIPILDSTAAILRRKLTGRSIYATDRGHMHHRLLNLLGTNRRVLLVLAVSCAATSAAALLSVFRQSDMIALIICGAVVIVFITTGVFGRAELLLLGSRLRRVGRSLARPGGTDDSNVSQTAIQLQGSREWESLWQEFLDSVDTACLAEIRLNVNLPAAQEGYHASWERLQRNDRKRSWRMEFPLALGRRPIGGLLIIGRHNQESACPDMQRLLEVIEPFERQLLDLADQEVSASTTIAAKPDDSKPDDSKPDDNKLDDNKLDDQGGNDRADASALEDTLTDTHVTEEHVAEEHVAEEQAT